jgi:ABC-2 type transport system permease protein
MGLAGFVLSAISVRFIFPAVSTEGEAFWVIKSSPLSLKRLLWGKFAFYLLPMIILGEVLILVTNYLLEVTPFMMILSSVTMLIAVFGIVSLGIGFGSLYPNFRYQNLAQVGTSFGGLVYMIFSTLFMALIILLEAGPVYLLHKADVAGKAMTWGQWLFVVTSFITVLVVVCIAVLRPLQIGLRALSDYES